MILLCYLLYGHDYDIYEIKLGTRSSRIGCDPTARCFGSCSPEPEPDPASPLNWAFMETNSSSDHDDEVDPELDEVP